MNSKDGYILQYEGSFDIDAYVYVCTADFSRYSSEVCLMVNSILNPVSLVKIDLEVMTLITNIFQIDSMI